jgi:hypothetical protein
MSPKSSSTICQAAAYHPTLRSVYRISSFLIKSCTGQSSSRKVGYFDFTFTKSNKEDDHKLLNYFMLDGINISRTDALVEQWEDYCKKHSPALKKGDEESMKMVREFITDSILKYFKEV